MKNDPDSRTEQWLQAYAQRRREQAGREVELHEATRRMLLDESKREWKDAAAPEPETAPAKESMFSWAWIGTVAAGVMLVAVISKNGSQGKSTDRAIKITKNISSSGSGNLVGQERTSTPPDNESILDGNKDQAGDADASSAVTKATLLPASEALSAPRPMALRRNAAAGLASSAVTDPRSAETFQATLPAHESSNFYSGPERLRQDFSPSTRRPVTRSDAPAIADKTLQPVLQNFQFERDGMDILVVDHDGSEYRGTVRALEKADLAGRDLPADKLKREEGKVVREQNPVLPARLGSSMPTEFFFQVTGTNRTLRKQVVFQGNILNELALKPKLSVEPLPLKVPTELNKKLADQKKTEDLPRLRIQGHAQVGKLQYDVDARNMTSSPSPNQKSPAKLNKDGSTQLPEK